MRHGQLLQSNSFKYNSLRKQTAISDGVRWLGSSRPIPRNVNSSSSQDEEVRRGRQARYIHTARRLRQHLSSTIPNTTHLPPPYTHTPPIRKRLEAWQEENGNPLTDVLAREGLNSLGDQYSSLADNHNGGNDERDDGQMPMAERDEVGDDLLYGKGVFYKPGDLIECLPSSKSTTAVLGVFTQEVDRQLQLITSRGAWTHINKTAVLFSVPNFVDPETIKPILPYLPTKETAATMMDQIAVMDINAPREVTAPLITAITSLRLQSQEIYRQNAAVLDSAHDILAHDTNLRFGTLQKIAENLIGAGPNATLPQLYAVRKALLAAGIGFGTDKRTHKTTGVFQIRSKEQLQQISIARDWLREYQEAETLRLTGQETTHEKKSVSAVRNFLIKARELIKASRELRPPTLNGCLGPSRERYPVSRALGAYHSKRQGTFTDDERILIRLIEYWSVQGLFQADESLRSLATLILRDTELYPDHELDQHTGYLFLQEIGVYDPFANHHIFDVDLLLPASQHSKPLQQLATKLQTMSPEDVDLKDSMADLRHDWKNLPAFAIDSSSTEEIDDAISVERIEGTPTEFWVHTHVANPTAFLKRDGVFSQMAAHLTESFYLPELVVPMLPKWMTAHFFSLKPDRPCLTFSGRINLDGEILDTKIQPGVVRNVIKLDYTDLPRLLGTSVVKPIEPYTLVVGGKLPEFAPSPLPSLSSDQSEDLNLLFQISKATQKRRVRNGALSIKFPSTNVSVFHSRELGLPPIYPHRNGPVFTHGDPIIELRGSRFVNPFTQEITLGSAEHLVQEIMVIAGVVGARWCQERNVPLLFRGTSVTDTLQQTDDATQRALRKYGTIPLQIGLESLENYGRAVIASSALPHRALGLDQYAKVTSPLRRFADMIAHWQIEAALRQESRFGIGSLKGATIFDQTSYLPYSKTAIDNVMTRLEPRERMIKFAGGLGQFHWISQAFMRIHEFGEIELPRLAPVVLTTGNRKDLMRMSSSKSWGVLLESSIKVQIMPKDRAAAQLMDDFVVGDVWECEFTRAFPYAKAVVFSPVRLLRKEMDTE